MMKIKTRCFLYGSVELSDLRCRQFYSIKHCKNILWNSHSRHMSRFASTTRAVNLHDLELLRDM